MKILHYFLGFPPFRTGGLTKYANDLMSSQVKEGHEVAALWPGQINSYNLAPVVKKRRNYGLINNYELINPLPIPLDEGISNVNAYTQKCDETGYRDFLVSFSPELIHIHTLMGLHKEFFNVANEMKIKVVMTSHDCFGICPKVTLYRFGTCCDNDNECRDCIQCNQNALSLNKIQLMQSIVYRKLKNTRIVKRLRKHHRDTFFQETEMPPMPNANIEEKAREYRKLRDYYIGMYEMMDMIHFNSTLTQEIYCRYFTPKASKVINISHSEIEDNRDNGHTESDIFRIYCLAPAKPFKGFDVLKRALDELWEAGNHNFELHVFSPIKDISPYMVVQEEGYQYEELSQMMRNADLVVAVSICYETFGFTVLEAISYGVPVIVSDHMGAKDLVSNSVEIVRAGDVSKLKITINDVMSKKYKPDNNRIVLWDDVVQATNNMYLELE